MIIYKTTFVKLKVVKITGRVVDNHGKVEFHLGSDKVGDFGEHHVEVIATQLNANWVQINAAHVCEV